MSLAGRGTWWAYIIPGFSTLLTHRDANGKYGAFMVSVQELRVEGIDVWFQKDINNIVRIHVGFDVIEKHWIELMFEICVSVHQRIHICMFSANVSQHTVSIDMSRCHWQRYCSVIPSCRCWRRDRLRSNLAMRLAHQLHDPSPGGPVVIAITWPAAFSCLHH